MEDQPGSTLKVPEGFAAKGALAPTNFQPPPAVEAMATDSTGRTMLRLVRNLIVLRQVWRLLKRRR